MLEDYLSMEDQRQIPEQPGVMLEKQWAQVENLQLKKHKNHG